MHRNDRRSLKRLAENRQSRSSLLVSSLSLRRGRSRGRRAGAFETAWNKIPSFKSTCVVPKNTRYSTQHFDVQKASDLLAFRRAISGGLFRTPGRDVALAIMDSATATVVALPAEGLYVLSPAASVSRIVAWLAFDSGKVRGASNIEGLSTSGPKLKQRFTSDFPTMPHLQSLHPCLCKKHSNFLPTTKY